MIELCDGFVHILKLLANLIVALLGFSCVKSAMEFKDTKGEDRNR